MSDYYRRKRPDRGENLRAGLVAGGLAAVVASVSFYLVRLLLAREPLDTMPPPGRGRIPSEDRPEGNG